MKRIQVSVQGDQIVWARSPVRMDLAGSWSDTPPYTYHYGGQVVNVAINLNGQPPVQVFVRRSEQPIIRIHSIDLGVTEVIASFSQLQNYQDPSSPFALAKAALALVGVAPADGKCLGAFLTECGGGLDLTSFVAVPKGSGLGTSSILAATLLAGLFRFFGRNLVIKNKQDARMLTAMVLETERMIGTGGGWQDQIGGVVGGVKFTSSTAQNPPLFHIEHLDSFLFLPEAELLCTLYYTGFTRLAKNILTEVVGRVEAGDKDVLQELSNIKKLAQHMRAAISSRDMGEVAMLIGQSFEANKRLHFSTTNADVEHLLGQTARFYKGAKLTGAGGGGFCLFVSESPKQTRRLRKYLAANPLHACARLVEFTLNQDGLVVSVS